MLPCSCSLPPSPKKGGKASNLPASACCGRQNPFSMFFIGFRTCRQAGFKCLRAAAACHQALRTVAKPPSDRLRPCMAAKIILYRVSNLPPAGFKCIRAAAACHEAPKRVAKPGFGLVWPPKSFFIGFRSAAACHQAARRVAKPGFGLLWPPKSFFIGFRTCRRAGFKCPRAAAACHQAARKVAKPPSNWLRPCMAAKNNFLSGF